MRDVTATELQFNDRKKMRVFVRWQGVVEYNVHKRRER